MTSVRTTLLVAALLASAAMTTHAQPDPNNFTLRSLTPLEGVRIFNTSQNATAFYVIRAGGSGGGYAGAPTIPDMIYSGATRQLYHGTQATVISQHTEDAIIQRVATSLDLTEVTINGTDNQSWWVATINVFPNR